MNISSVSTGIRYTSNSALFGKNVDWSKVPSKDYNSPPASDIRSMVRQNAREYANATTDEERTRLKNEADTLFHKYVSQAAPDRKKLLSSARTAIGAMGSSVAARRSFKLKITRSKTIIDYFIEAQNKNKKKRYEISFEGGSVTKESDGSYTARLGGESAISITATGITFIPSGAELKSQQEIVDFWNQNRTAAIAENEGRPSRVGGIDVKA
ncbi:MAG: hypothetical protein LBM87_01240 [Ruminococcus sp.]|jgi:vacuolar-type H+-ATPase subunit H|nr:hypothetical protein [Ruminococcus sp.]